MKINKEELLNQKELKMYLKYNKRTGIFRWKKCKETLRVKKNDVAGTLSKDGYTIIKINSKQYASHRLAWLYKYGHFPKQEIDHINHIKTDNSIRNLRDVSSLENSKNRILQKNNKSGFNGVYFDNTSGKWKSTIVVNKKSISLGCHLLKEEAINARKEANLKYGFMV